ncbi:efflux RND transporter periplasmic adaptor subunit [Xanthomonas hortorum]|uniref:efflux RND transporter periplasmic adaptor subunit n=1 Tax=Xanthomonas hortorum TaxID=56454 RepID=UPI0032E85F5E
MTRSMTRMAFIASAVALLAIGLAGGYWWAQRHAAGSMEMPPPTPSASPDRKALYWYDPMVPDQHFDKPGKSPFMDMQLVPKYADDAAASGVGIDSGTQQSVGIRTAVVETGRLTTEIRVPATLTWDLRQESVVSTRVDAIILRLNVKAPYEPVRRGQPLASLLAPDWSSALAESQALRQAQSASARELQSAAQQRLRVLGAPSGMGRDGSVTLSAPSDGVVSEILVREGQTVMAGMPLFRINGTVTLWLEAAIPQAGIGGVGPGTKVEATVSAVPGQTFAGEVETLLPQIDPTSRTQRARIVLRNPDGVLVPGMFAELSLQPEAGAAVPLVPNEALIATGTDSRVIVVGDDGRFQPVRVRSGRSSGGRTEILAGLKGGERVVTSGQFLIDSEASLSGALQRLEAPAASSAIAAAPSMQEMALPVEKPSTAIMPKPAAKPKPTSAQRACPVLYWYDPMVPDKHFDQPGKSPFMDMQLVPKFGPDAAADCTVRDVGATAPKEPRP